VKRQVCRSQRPRQFVPRGHAASLVELLRVRIDAERRSSRRHDVGPGRDSLEVRIQNWKVQNPTSRAVSKGQLVWSNRVC